MDAWTQSWWNYFLQTPFSGSVSQNIHPSNTWWSPNVEFNFAGNKLLETKIISEVASYGTQLDKLAAAVLELANGDRASAVQELETMVDKIEAKKREEKENLSNRIKVDLARLKVVDPTAFQDLMHEYLSMNTDDHKVLDSKV